MVAWTRAEGRTDLLRDGYIAERSQHNRGLAIDVSLVDLATGRPLDMGTPWDSFTKDAAPFAMKGVHGANRKKLREALLRRGFAPYDREWWHFVWKAEAPELDVPYGAGDPDPR
jgi:D-alanyl-D-alanine dipeptidase